MKKIFFLGLAFVAVLGSYALAQRPGVNSTLQTVFAIPLDGSMRTYGAAKAAVSPGSATATDVFEICGSASNTIRVTRIAMSGRATAVSSVDVGLLKRSTASSGGTFDPVTPTAFDSNSAAATATLKAFSLNPTVGTLVGALIQRQLQLGNLTTGVGGEPLLIEFNANRAASGPIALRGTGQCLVVNLNGANLPGNSLNFSAEWTEGE
jgi:hypothetical protein